MRGAIDRPPHARSPVRLALFALTRKPNPAGQSTLLRGYCRWLFGTELTSHEFASRESVVLAVLPDLESLTQRGWG